MMMMKATSLSAFLVVCLSACGGGGGGSDSGGSTVTPATSNLTGNPATEFSFNDAANTVTVNGTVINATTRSAIVVPDNFTAFANGSASIVAFHGVTPSGGGTTTVYSTGNGVAIGAFAQRLDDTRLPDAGSVGYSGQYAGIYRVESSNSNGFTISGNVQLTADFDDGSIDGAITSRVARQEDNETFGMSDVTLQNTTLAGGGFVGTTSGGDLLSLRDISGGVRDGDYAGLIVGETGDEIVGNINLQHTLSGTVFAQEVGAFIATE